LQSTLVDFDWFYGATLLGVGDGLPGFPEQTLSTDPVPVFESKEQFEEKMKGVIFGVVFGWKPPRGVLLNQGQSELKSRWMEACSQI
jgi:hypothetical protein